MKTYLLTFALVALCPVIYGQQAGDFRSRSGGSWTDITSATPWETYDGSGWITATSTPSPTSDVTIRSGHTISLSVSLQPCNNLLIESGGKLYSNTASSTARYINIYGNIVCDGIIGNGVIGDGLGFNIMNHTTITGSGTFDCNRIKQGANQVCRLVISRDINLRYGGTCLYNDDPHNGSVFNVVVERGAYVAIIGNGTTNGDLSVDGPSGVTSGNSNGSILIKGNVSVRGTTYMRTNNTNTSYPVSITIDSTGKLETGAVVCSASGAAGHVLTINSGGVLNITGDNTAGFTQPGTINNAYVFNNGSIVEYGRSGNQYIYDFGADYQHLKISGSGIKSLQAAAAIDHSLEVVDASAFNTNGYSCTLKSTALQTAAVKNITSTVSPAISGDITVERYIPARRAWRLLAAPLSPGSAPTIYNAWQEGGVSGASLPGYGTWVTSAATAGPGFDAASATSSLRCYDVVADTFTAPANTNTIKVTDNGGAYMVFVRGDRTITGSGTPNNTILRMRGVINQGMITCGSNIAGTLFTLVPNPYPSAVDFEAIYTSNNNLTSFYIWDAQHGMYGMYRLVTRTGPGTYIAVPSTSADNDLRYIQSGQAFFIQGTAAGGAGTVTFMESMKATETPSAAVFKVANDIPQLLSVDLEKQTASGNLLNDGIAIFFDSAYTSGFSNKDIKKLKNFNENLSVWKDTSDLIVERRSLPAAADTLQLHLWNTTTANYQFTVTPGNLHSFAAIYLLDNHLNTATVLNNTGRSAYNFSIDSATGSYDPFRFRLVFVNAAPLPLAKLTLNGAMRRTAADLQWEVLNEAGVKHYDVERSNDGGKTFDKLNTVAPKAGANSSAGYSFSDESMPAGVNYYRIKSIGVSGKERFSNIILLYHNTKLNPGITVFPNPANSHNLQISFEQLERGIYQAALYTMSGVLVEEAVFIHTAQNTVYSFSSGKTIATGLYRVEVRNDATGISCSRIVQID